MQATQFSNSPRVDRPQSVRRTPIGSSREALDLSAQDCVWIALVVAGLGLAAVLIGVLTLLVVGSL